VEIGGGGVEAVTFLADHRADAIVPDLPRDAQIAYAATGEGVLGTSFEYVENLSRGFAAIGIEDAEISDLLAAIKKKRAAP